MRFFGALLAFSLIGCAGGQREAPPLCQAFADVVAAAERTGVPQEIRVFNSSDPSELACGSDTRFAANSQYCSSVLAHVSYEFTHIYPWQLHDCLIIAGSRPEIETIDEYTGLQGREKIVRLSATLQGGTNISLQYAPDEEGHPANRLNHYYGRWDLRISPESNGRTD